MSKEKVPQCEEFQLDVQQYADLLTFAQVRSVNVTPCFVITKFHQEFYTQISIARDFTTKFEDEYFYGIEGIGKTLTLIRYVLECYKRKDYKVHYVDLATIESEKKLEEFIAYSKHFKDDDCLIIDHITVFNNNLVKKIKQTVKAKLRYILIETGFTTSNFIGAFGKKWQLDEEEFEKIWVRTLKSVPNVIRCEELIGMCKEIYAHFSKEGHLITPRLLNFAWHRMCNQNQSLAETSFFYNLEKQKKIEDFVEIEDDNPVYKAFIAHTRYFLYHVAEDADYILHPRNCSDLHLAVNVFDVEFHEVTEDNLKNDIRFHNLGFGEGEYYVRIRHLVPKLAKYWAEKLPYRFDSVFDDSPALLNIIFRNGGVHKEIKNLVVQFQREKHFAIIPADFSETNEMSLSQWMLEKTRDVHVFFKPTDAFFFVGLDELQQFKSSVTDFSSDEKNLAKCAFWIKENVMQDAFLLYPEIGNLMGVDYFVFLPDNHCDVAQPKAPKLRKTLFMVQVALGQSHIEHTMGRARNILKKILSNADIMIHLVVLISFRNEYTCSKRSSGVSVINIADTYLHHKFKEKLLGK